MSKRVLIIECTPKNQWKNEGLVLSEFLNMTVPRRVASRRAQSKRQLISYLSDKKDLRKFGFIHLSGHGYGETCEFCTPKGDLTPEDFPEDCFSGKAVTFSACALGKSAFVQRLMAQTQARYVVAPQRDVLFVDAALWFVAFYYQALHLDVRAKTAYDRAETMLQNVRGGFQFWS